MPRGKHIRIKDRTTRHYRDITARLRIARMIIDEENTGKLFSWNERQALHNRVIALQKIEDEVVPEYRYGDFPFDNADTAKENKIVKKHMFMLLQQFINSEYFDEVRNEKLV